jgi:hypothetical protein
VGEGRKAVGGRDPRDSSVLSERRQRLIAACTKAEQQQRQQRCAGLTVFIAPIAKVRY